MVYFISDGDAIKIGYSNKIRARLSDIQVSSVKRLTLIGTMRGGREVERIIHHRFKHLRIKGEWYKSAPELLHFIKAQNVPFYQNIVTRSAYHLRHGMAYYRNALNKTQVDLSKESGITQATISRMESGNGSTEIETVYDICAALGLEIVLRPRDTRKFISHELEGLFEIKLPQQADD